MIGSTDSSGHAAEVGDEPLDGGLVTRAHGGGGLEQPLQAGREDAAHLLLEDLDQRGREELGVLGKAIGRRRRRGARNIESRHGGGDGRLGGEAARQ